MSDYQESTDSTTSNRHLFECLWYWTPYICICGRLRAAERRGFLIGWGEGHEAGFREGQK